MSGPEETRTLPRTMAGLPVRAIHIEVLTGESAGDVAGDGLERVRIGSAAGNDLVVKDPTVSRFHLEVIRRADKLAIIDHQSTNGTRVGPATVFGGEVCIDSGTIVEIGATKLRISEGPIVMVELGSLSGFGGVRGRSASIRRLTAMLEKVSKRDTPVLLIGESGSGKEVVARALHEAGSRSKEPLVTFDCGAVSSSLLIAEIMGHERGAFTGANQSRPGLFERAHGGTVFLDELGELPLEHQSALLGVLERRKVRRVGGNEDIPVDVHVIAATHRDLKAAVNAGTFRLDLYYRLAVVTLHVPPLRERSEDIPLLIEHFLREEGELGPLETHFSTETLRDLARHAWPGNVRELRNFVLATLATGESPTLSPESQPATLSGHGAGARWSDALLDGKYKDARRSVLDEFEQVYLRRLLDRSGGNVREAARMGGMDRSYLTELLSKQRLR